MEILKKIATDGFFKGFGTLECGFSAENFTWRLTHNPRESFKKILLGQTSIIIQGRPPATAPHNESYQLLSAHIIVNTYNSKVPAPLLSQMESRR